MKTIMLFFVVCMANSICSSKYQNQDLEFMVIYKAQTRGSNLEYTIDDTSIKALSNGYDGKNGKAALLADDKKEIQAFIDTLALENINSLIPPSQNSAVDRALIAQIQITKNGERYESVDFDHGNPPVALKPLIDKILALIETVE